MSGYKAVHLDEIAAEKWPYWAPIRHELDIRSFGINAWRGADGDEVIKRHSEEESGQEELYIVLSGRGAFTVGGDEIDAPAGTLIYITEPGAVRGTAYEPSGWDTGYLEAE